MNLRATVARSLLVLATAGGIALVGCKDDEPAATPTTPDGTDGGATTSDGGTVVSPNGTDGSAPVEAGVQSPPGTALALPFDTMLLTFGRPRTGDTDTDIALTTSFYYAAAYELGQLATTKRSFRFVARTFQATGELPPEGVRVWWMTLLDDGRPSNWACRKRDALADIITLSSYGDPETEAEPEDLYRQQCSWTLWKHPTEDKWAIRGPGADADAEESLLVTLLHSTANQAYHVQVAGGNVGDGPFFTFKKKP